MKALSAFGFPFGISMTFWFIVGLIRLITEKIKPRPLDISLKPSDIAVILPAHNEEVVIRNSIRALKQTLRAKQIYVISDGSTDDTVERARLERVNISILYPGVGKAKAIVYALEHYHLFNRYKFIFIVDADTKIDRAFVSHALRILSDPDIAVVFGTAKINWPKHIWPTRKLYFIAYRERLNRLMQYFLVYGQTWKYTSVNYVVPGFATIYRSKVLKKLRIDVPGILVEDFNLAFQLHKKKLGKIGYSPSMIGWDQHPNNLKEYWSQVKRWNTGFFQTVKKNGIWPSFFWLSLGIFTLEIVVNSLFIIFIPFILLYILSSFLAPYIPFFSSFHTIYLHLGPYNYVTLQTIVLGVFLFDYITTVIIGLVNKKPQFIIYGLFFIFLHVVTSLIFFSALIPGFFSNSDGKWVSPTRRNE